MKINASYKTNKTRQMERNKRREGIKRIKRRAGLMTSMMKQVARKVVVSEFDMVNYIIMTETFQYIQSSIPPEKEKQSMKGGCN